MKQNKLHVDTILEYLEGSQLFVARDEFGTMYLCLLYDDQRYTAIRISSSRLVHFGNKQVDLRSLYVSPENAGEFFDVTTGADGSLNYSPLPTISEDRLPAEGFFLTTPMFEKVTLIIPTQDKGLLWSIARHFGWVVM